MENIILTNNKDLRLVSVKVGVLSTLRFELPLVPESATHVEVIVTSGDVHSAYTATFISATKFWQCDIAASQFPAVGKQSYEVAYVLDGKQFWDGKGWIEIEDATTSGIEPQPRPEPYRYTVLSVNGYGADAQGAVRIPKTFIATDSPATTEGFMDGDIYFNRLTGATWTLCNVLGTLTWVFNYKNYYTKAETDEAIDKLAAYYITADAQGHPFATRAALVNASTYYSGGELRVPTRNDYAVVLADEAHGGAEWRYIYAVAGGQTTGQWEAQYPIETNDYDALANKPSINNVTLTGNKTAADLGLATKADATLTPMYSDTPTFSEWSFNPATDRYGHPYVAAENGVEYILAANGEVVAVTESYSNATMVSWVIDTITITTATRTRTDIIGYVLGSQSDKPLASEAEAEALRTGKQDALSAQQLANIDAVPNKLGNSGAQRITNGSLKVVGGNISLDGTHKFMLDEVFGIGLVLDGNRVVGISFGDGAAKNVVLPLDGEDTIAFLSNIYAAIQQIAPAFDAKTYQAKELCSYNGVIYRCKLGYTSTASSPKPDADTTHWEAKKVSELFLQLTGGTVTGALISNSSGEVGTVDGLQIGVTGDEYTRIRVFQDATTHNLVFYRLGSWEVVTLPMVNGKTITFAASNPTAGNLAALDANGNPTDAGYRFEVRGGIPYIIETTND